MRGSYHYDHTTTAMHKLSTPPPLPRNSSSSNSLPFQSLPTSRLLQNARPMLASLRVKSISPLASSQTGYTNNVHVAQLGVPSPHPNPLSSGYGIYLVQVGDAEFRRELQGLPHCQQRVQSVILDMGKTVPKTQTQAQRGNRHDT